jgi:hypothetical protein
MIVWKDKTQTSTVHRFKCSENDSVERQNSNILEINNTMTSDKLLLDIIGKRLVSLIICKY